MKKDARGPCFIFCFVWCPTPNWSWVKIQFTNSREDRRGLRWVQIGFSLWSNKFLFVYSIDTGRQKTDRKSSDRTGRGFERKEGTWKNLSLENEPGGELQSAVLNGMSQASVFTFWCAHVKWLNPVKVCVTESFIMWARPVNTELLLMESVNSANRAPSDLYKLCKHH